MPRKISIPDQTLLEKRFIFIKDSTLKTNTIITLRYIIFLINLEREESLPGPIIYSMYKDIIVQTATIIEACVHYTLKQFIEQDKVKSSEVMTEEWKEEKCEILLELENGNKQVCGVIRHRASDRLTHNTQFISLNRACLKAKIFTDQLFKEAEELREARNKIHLAGLTAVDDLYKKEEVDKYFEYATNILKRIEDKLKEL